MTMQKQIAAVGVRTGAILNHHGKIKPKTPNISQIPINVITAAGSPFTPVWPCVISHRSDWVDFIIPEARNPIAKSI